MTISDSKPVSAIMTTTPVVANQFTNFSQVLTLFSEYPVRHLPIVDGKNNLIGIVSVNDLTKVFVNLCNRPDPIFMTLDNIDKAINIKDIMTPNPVTVSSADPISKAIKIFAEKKFMSLPVVDNGVLLGIITTKDIMAFLA